MPPVSCILDAGKENKSQALFLGGFGPKLRASDLWQAQKKCSLQWEDKDKIPNIDVNILLSPFRWLYKY